jgi:hypothetical protein
MSGNDQGEPDFSHRARKALDFDADHLASFLNQH